MFTNKEPEGPPTVFGSSSYLDLHLSPFFARASFYDFAPSPFQCVCCNFLVPDDQRKRTYAVVYPNKFEANLPIAPFCCLTSEMCMVDRTFLYYYDKPPSRVGMFCGIFPCTICGPPVIYSYRPKICCVDVSDCFGQKIMSAPCNCFGLKICLCFGNPCYTQCSLPLLTGVKDPAPFLSAFKYAVDAYKGAKNLDDSQMAIFEDVEDNIFDLGRAKKVKEHQEAQVKMARK